MDTPRPPHISSKDWAAMPWYARMRASRRAGLHIVVADEQAPAPEPTTRPAPKVRVYRVQPGCWEITNGVSTARTATAQAAWRLLDTLRRTA